MELFDQLLNFFFPPHCASCKTEGDFLCKNCVHNFKIAPLKTYSHNLSRAEFKYLDGVIYAAEYAKNPELQLAIRQFKYKFTKPLIGHFSRLLAEKLSQLSMTKNKAVVLIPVPLHKKRLNYRGFNQAQLLSEAVSEIYRVATVAPLLRRVKHTPQQAKLSKKERHQNLKEAFELSHEAPFESRAVYFLVDDVCTTGSTLDECARVLKSHGLKKVYGLVVARAFK